MPKIPEIIPISDLRQDAASVVRRVHKSTQPLIVTQRGRAAVVLVSIDEFERAEHERELLKALARGDREIESTEGYELEEVLRDADAILKG